MKALRAAPPLQEAESSYYPDQESAVLEAEAPQPIPEPPPEYRESADLRGFSADIHKLLPQSQDAELGVLGSILLSPQEVMTECVAKNVVPGYFHVPAHRLVYEVIRELYDAQKPIDFILLTQLLRDRQLLDKAGGPAFVTSLFTFVPTAANAGYYIEILKEKYALREIIVTCNDFASRSYEERDNVDGFISEVSTKVEQIARSRIGGSNLPSRKDMATLMYDAMPAEPEQLVKGLLHRASKLVLGGTSKGRKTWALIDLAVSVATGSDFWGFPTQKGRVCYINFEIQEAFFARRCKKVCQSKEVRLDEGMLTAWTLRGHLSGIESMAEDIIRALMHEDYVLIIFDPIYKALGNRDENKAGDVASLCNELEKIAVQTNAAVAFGAHFSKGNQAQKEAIDRIGGSGVFARDPDAILTMTAHESEEHYVVEPTLRNFAPIEPFVLMWEYPLFTPDTTADPKALKNPAGKKDAAVSHTQETILAEMSALDGLSTGFLRKRCDSEHGIPRATFYRYWSNLKKQKKVIEKQGKWLLAPK